MTAVSLRAFLAASSVAVLFLAGCGSSGIAPTLLVDADVNGAYAVTATGAATDPVLFNGSFASTQPKSNSGDGYVDSVAGNLTNTANLDLGACDGTTFQLAGTITNPSGNNVLINMTGSAPGGGTMTVNGMVFKGKDQVLGGVLAVNVTITGSCALASTAVVATRS